MELNVLLLTDADAFAGTERHMLDLAVALRDVGVKVTLSCPEGAPLAKRGEQVGLANFAIPKGGLIDWNAVKLLKAALKAKQFDVLHAHNGRMHLSAALAILLARRGTLVFTQHFIQPGHTRSSGLKSKVFGRVHHFVAGRTHRFIAISNAVKSAMLERHEAENGRIEVVPNGIGDPQQTALASPGSVREKYNIAADSPLLVCAARLEPEKDHSSLLKAFEEVLKEVPNAQLLLAGRGGLERELRNQVERLDLNEFVQVLGFVEEAHALIAAADVFVLPSPREPFGLVFLEAMALQKPVVACNEGAAPEIVVDGVTGLLVSPHKPAEMGKALVKLLSNPALAKQMGMAGQERYFKAFTRERMAQGALEVYKTATKGARR